MEHIEWLRGKEQTLDPPEGSKPGFKSVSDVQMLSCAELPVP